MLADAPQSADEQLEISCQSCGATVLVAANMRTVQCPYCASTSIVERPPTADRPDPTFVLGFVIDRDRAKKSVRRWLRNSGVFARSDFKEAAPEVLQGVYVPAYLYGAVAHTNYTADIGENYTETETYTTTDAKGNTVVRTRTVTRTEWRPLRGNHACYVLDVIVTASHGVSNNKLEAIEPYDLRALNRYSHAAIAGWMAEDPSRTQEECFQLAHQESVQKVGRMLDEFMPGDSHRDLRYHTSLSNEVIDLVLLPLWTFAVKYNETKPPVRILLNGQTGKITGDVPISAKKVTTAIIVGLGIILAIILFVAAFQ
ncbi:hypothetical protein Pan258_60310 [Symmachiella dynata]|uniref:hypothetical protein n=1 Tax=Symmachiella dynata TaxID=2527995 RepID=UPI00118B80D1|nr:hypothetical protein [Symmachiella dynata]QDT51934.1 hypothetical protein Pan258_60310 [Symmachiella dynata]